MGFEVQGPTAPPKAYGSSQPRSGIRIVEGRGDQSQWSEAVGSKGKGKDGVCLGPPSEKPTSPPSLEALMFDPPLFEEFPLEVPNKGAFSSLEEVYGGEVVKEARELLKDTTPFKMATIVSVGPFFFFFLLIALCHYLCRLAFLVPTWSSTVTGDNTSLAVSLLYAQVLEHYTTRCRRNPECPSLRKSWRKPG